MTSHCRDPQRCSVCLGASARAVTLDAGQVMIDGQPEGRAVDPGTPAGKVRRGRRGGRAMAMRSNRGRGC